MSSETDGEANRLKVDRVFAEGVRLGAILREEASESCWQFDLTSLTFPVARAACRYFISNRIQRSTPENLKDITFVTGSGAQRPPGSGLTLREYVQAILKSDFTPRLLSTVPDQAQGTVNIQAKTLRDWMKDQPVSNML